MGELGNTALGYAENGCNVLHHQAFLAKLNNYTHLFDASVFAGGFSGFGCGLDSVSGLLDVAVDGEDDSFISLR